jgi:hypothetical protein
MQLVKIALCQCRSRMLTFQAKVDYRGCPELAKLLSRRLAMCERRIFQHNSGTEPTCSRTLSFLAAPKPIIVTNDHLITINRPTPHGIIRLSFTPLGRMHVGAPPVADAVTPFW